MLQPLPTLPKPIYPKRQVSKETDEELLKAAGIKPESALSPEAEEALGISKPSISPRILQEAQKPFKPTKTSITSITPSGLLEESIGDIKEYIHGGQAVAGLALKFAGQAIRHPIKTTQELPQTATAVGKAIYTSTKTDLQEYLQDPAGKFAKDPLFFLLDVASLATLGVGGTAAVLGRTTKTARVLSRAEKLEDIAKALDAVSNPASVVKLAVKPLKNIPIVGQAIDDHAVRKAMDKLLFRSNRRFMINRNKELGQIKQLFSKLSQADKDMFYDLVEGTALPKDLIEVIKQQGGDIRFLKELPDNISPELKSALQGWRAISNEEKTILQGMDLLKPETAEKVIWQPLEAATGLSSEQIKILFGTFNIESPGYLPHLFERKVRFADFFMNKPIRMGSLPSFLRERTTGGGRFFEPADPRIGKFIPDPGKLLIQHRAQFIKYIHNKQLVEEIGQRFGKRIDNPTPALLRQIEAEGFEFNNKTYPIEWWYPHGYVNFYKKVVKAGEEIAGELGKPHADIIDATAEAVANSVMTDYLKTVYKVAIPEAEMTELEQAFRRSYVQPVLEAPKARAALEESLKRFTKEVPTPRTSTTATITKYLPIPKDVPIYAVPKPLIDRLRQYVTPRDTGLWGQMGLLYDESTQLFRMSWLTLSPRWVINNTMGNVMLNTMAGVGPLSYLRALQKKFKDVVPEEVTVGIIDVETYLPELGHMADTPAGKLVQLWRNSAIMKALEKTEKGLHIRQFNEGVESYFRRALYINKAVKLSKQLTMTEIGRVGFMTDDLIEKLKYIARTPEMYETVVEGVNKWLFDYFALSPTERRVIRRIIPFWSWIKNINRIIYTLPFEHPLRAELISIIDRAASDVTGQEELPPQVRGTVSLDEAYRLRGGGLAVLSEAVPPSSEAAAKAGLHPVLQIAIEQATGHSIYTQRALLSPDIVQDPWTGIVFKWSEKHNDIIPIDRIKPKVSEQIARQLPHLMAAQGIYEWFVQTVLNEPPIPIQTKRGLIYPPSPWTKTLQLLGIPITPAPQKEWNERIEAAKPRARAMIEKQMELERRKKEQKDRFKDAFEGLIQRLPLPFNP